MELYYHQRFKKQYRKLDRKQHQKVDNVIRIFVTNPRDPHLRNHPLKGDMLGRRAISVTSDLRIIFRHENSYQRVILLGIGTHNQVYK